MKLGVMSALFGGLKLDDALKYCQKVGLSAIELPAGAPAPLDLLDRFIEETSHRVILEACGCRTARRCERHPHDIGCLLMGDSALESPPSIRREVGVSEAREHVARAVEAGLVPQVGKARVDNYIFGIKETRHLLTTCFCCDCCECGSHRGEHRADARDGF